MRQVSNFFASAPEKTFRKGSIIISPEDKPEKVYYLTHGKVKQFVSNSDGAEIIIHIFRPGSYFPIMLVLGEATNRFYFQALTKCKVKISSSDTVVEFLKKERLPLYDLTVRFAKGLNGLSTRLEGLLGEKAVSRIVSLLLYLSDKFGKQTNEGIKINLPLSHQEIAKWVGLERETVSRQMKSLSDKGLIKYKRRKITIIDSKALGKTILPNN